ncbi:MAG: hypothetical protein M3Q19_12575 [Pseudomonadota bacterium]|nr:hypothetical protein [Pseudomonadota bacterium]
MIQATAEMLQEQKRWLSGIRVAPAAIGEAVAIDLDEAGRCGEMGVGHFKYSELAGTGSMPARSHLHAVFKRYTSMIEATRGKRI